LHDIVGQGNAGKRAIKYFKEIFAMDVDKDNDGLIEKKRIDCSVRKG